MSKAQDLQSEIAKKTGVVIGKDDPIMILLSANEKMTKDAQENQKSLLDQFQKDMDVVSIKANNELLERAQKILNASLLANKSAIDNQIQASMGAAIERMIESIPVREERGNNSTNTPIIAVVASIISALVTAAGFLYFGR
jgi:hypothetical protein